MEAEICPVCTLYLRPGITLNSHLGSHPKQKVIEALVNTLKNDQSSTPGKEYDSGSWPVWNQPAPVNHSFIYQQFMSTSQPPLGQQYITIPTVFNSPYVYQQQQQLFVSSSTLPPIGKPPVDNPQEAICFYDTDEKTNCEDSNPPPDYLHVRQDLNKACQTTHEQNSDGEEQEEAETSENLYETNAPPPSTEILDLNGVQLILCNNLLEPQTLSEVRDFECNAEKPVLMNIGEADKSFQDDGISQHSEARSIRADENMPPMGELSGQESNETNEIWHHERRSPANYDFFTRETWHASSEPSDCENSRTAHSTDNFQEELDDTPTIISVTEAPLNFKCPTCGKGFACPKERKLHQAEDHNKAGVNLIGADVPNRGQAGKKLTIKPKRPLQVKRKVLEESLKKEGEEGGGTDAGKEALGYTLEFKQPVSEVDGVKFHVCLTCGLTHSDAASLQRHTEKAHPHAGGCSHRCDTCGEGFISRNNFIRHLKKHPLECKLCGRYFYRRQNMELHMKRHLGLKPFPCDFCKKTFFTKQKLQEHRNTHTGESPIKCNLCHETFRRYSNLVQHRNVHHYNLKKKVKDYICHCGEVLHSKKKFVWHKEIHDAKPKACTKCSEKFIHMSSLTRHIRRTHDERFVPVETRVGENVECPICKNVYLKSSLEAHIKRHEGSRHFVCLTCNKEFTTKWNLKLHNWTHASSSSRPFKCDLCKSGFIRECELAAHVNAHKHVKPYTCNYCGAQFIRKNNCQRHVREHETVKTFVCQICGKSFHRSYYLKDHMKVHSGDRPYACQICGKTSATKSNHNKHVMIHHAKDPVGTEN